METRIHVPYVTEDMAARTHTAGMQVISRTVENKPTLRALIPTGVVPLNMV